MRTMSLNDELREAMERDGRTRYALSKVTGIPASVLHRFVHGDGLNIQTVEKLADALGYDLRLVKRSKSSKGDRR